MDHFPPTSKPLLDALLDQIHAAESFDKAKKDSLLFYLLLSVYPSPSFPEPSLQPSPSASSRSVQHDQRRIDWKTLREARKQERAYRFAALENLSPALTRPIRAYYLLDHGFYLEALSYMDAAEMDFKQEILQLFAEIPEDYNGGETGAAGDGVQQATWPLGNYRAKAFAWCTETLRMDLLAEWQKALRAGALADDGSERKEAESRLTWAEKQLTVYASAIAFEKGVWTAWEQLVEVVVPLAEDVLPQLQLDMDKPQEAGVADGIVERAIKVKEQLARRVWDHCFYRELCCVSVSPLVSLYCTDASLCDVSQLRLDLLRSKRWWLSLSLRSPPICSSRWFSHPLPLSPCTSKLSLPTCYWHAMSTKVGTSMRSVSTYDSTRVPSEAPVQPSQTQRHVRCL